MNRVPAWGLLLCLVAAACSGSEGTAPAPDATAAITNPPTSFVEPAESSTTVLAPATSAAPEAPPAPIEDKGPFDYRSVATEEKVVDTVLGRMTWIHANRVPGAWLDAGFPSLRDVNEIDRETEARIDEAFGNAPCCLTVFPAFDDAWIGLGTTTWTKAERDQYLESLDDAAVDDRCAHPWRVWSEVWFSPDGKDWQQRTEQAFGEAGLDPCTDGPWLLSGDRGAVVVEFPTSALPYRTDSDQVEQDPQPLVAWASDDLIVWQRGTFDIEKPGMITRLTGGVATANGWVLFGMRVSAEPADRSSTGIPLGPFTVEWAGWASPNGLIWESFDAPSIFGEPPCVPEGAQICGWIQPDTVGDAIIAYLRYWPEGTTPGPHDPWILWIGVPDEPATE